MKNLLLIALVLLCASCETQGGDAQPDEPKSVQWRQITPPREGLECWQAYHNIYYTKGGTQIVIQCWPVEVKR